MNKTELRKQMELGIGAKTTVEKTLSFGVDELRAALGLLGKKFDVPEGATFTVRIDANLDEGDPAVKGVAVDISGIPSPVAVVDFRFEWTEDASLKPGKSTPTS